MQMVDNTGDAINIDDTIRFKRWTDEGNARARAKSPSLSTVNSLARYALLALRPRSIPCLYRTLCLGNRQARNFQDGFQYWLPLWQ